DCEDRNKSVEQKSPGPDKKRTRASCDGSRDCRLDLRRVADLDNANLLANRLRCRLDLYSFSVGLGGARIDQHGNSARLGDKLAKQLKPLTAHRARNENYSCNIAA